MPVDSVLADRDLWHERFLAYFHPFLGKATFCQRADKVIIFRYPQSLMESTNFRQVSSIGRRLGGGETDPEFIFLQVVDPFDRFFQLPAPR